MTEHGHRHRERLYELVRYEEACRAIAEARSVDEVKEIRSRADAMRAYSRQAKNRELEADAVEIRMRATRRLDALIEAQRQSVGLNRGAKGSVVTGLGRNPLKDDRPTLAEAGIDKNLAHHARTLGNMSDEKFEEAVSDARLAVTRVIRTAANIVLKAERRAARLADLEKRILALPTRKYGLLYEDFEYDDETWSDRGKDRHASNLYLTASDAHTPEEIVQRTKRRFECAAPNCALFTWTTPQHHAIALDVMRLRGFEYRSEVIWRKIRPGKATGKGFWFRNMHEILMVGVRGNIPAPVPGDQWESVIEAPVSEHSRKPEVFAEMIEAYFPNLPKIELNRRGPPRNGWDAWGNEVEAPAFPGFSSHHDVWLVPAGNPA